MKNIRILGSLYFVIIIFIAGNGLYEYYYDLRNSTYDVSKLTFIKSICLILAWTVIAGIVYLVKSIYIIDFNDSSDTLGMCSLVGIHPTGELYRLNVGLKEKNLHTYQELCKFIYGMGIDKDNTFVNINENDEKHVLLSLDDYIILYNALPTSFIYFNLDLVHDCGIIDFENKCIIKHDFLQKE